MNQANTGVPRIPALNFHVWQPCNMGCKYCFASFEDTRASLRLAKPALKQRALAVIQGAANAGIKKITFVGGEPTLCPWLGELLDQSKRFGMVTMLVTNGTRLRNDWLRIHGSSIDWIALSVDSLDSQVNEQIGRVSSGRAATADFYNELVDRVRVHGCRLKINTVVSSRNWHEDLTSFIRRCNPERWKIFQALHVLGENDVAFPEFAVTAAQFNSFVARHKAFEAIWAVEHEQAMLGSYLMVDPLGRFFTNASGSYACSDPIWAVGWEHALAQVDVDYAKFRNRGGLYDWGESGLSPTRRGD